MKRKLIISIIILIVATLVVTPALAITFGELDGYQHPNVGAVGETLPDGTIDIHCTGTLVAPDVFLTAAHCYPFYSDDEVYVTFDPVYEYGVSTLHRGTFIGDPNYGHDMADPHDIAVVILDEPIADIQPASLPPAGLLDELKEMKALKGQEFVTVGYGITRDDKTGGPHSFNYDRTRRFSTGSYTALVKSWLKISMNPSTGDGGTCYGDSGGPHFLDDMVVSITITGDAYCRSTDVTYRTDSESARSFLGQFVVLP